MSDAVVVHDVVKGFGTTTALAGVSCTVNGGELFGFIGPDGAGKTTLLRILATLLVPDRGTATVLGQDVVRAMWPLRARIGYMPGRFSLYPDLSVDENLRFFASVFGTTVVEQERIAPIYKQLKPFRTRKAGALSGGMKQKLALCCALVHQPDILFLDEPTTGVDAVSRREFWDLLSALTSDGLTAVVTTPYMDEADRCNRVALIQHGQLLAVDTPSAVAASFGRPLFAIRAEAKYAALKALREYAHTHSAYPFGDSIHFTDKRADLAADAQERELRAFLSVRGLGDVPVAATPPTVEDTFIARMGAGEDLRRNA